MSTESDHRKSTPGAGASASAAETDPEAPLTDPDEISTQDESRYLRARGLFNRLIELPAEERVDQLAEMCADDPELLREVEALLAADAEAQSFLGRAADEIWDKTDETELAKSLADPIGERVGHYRLTALLGRGGMGEVYLAERVDGQYEQEVAIKLLKPGMDSREIVRRFLRERQILARLEHPHIARLLDGGLTDDGRPYFVLERVEGLPINEHCAKNEFGLRRRMQLMIEACDAVATAHRQLIVHRDLKPSNIMVDNDGGVKLLDFGIAKLLQEGEGETLLTRADARALTPAYAAPEQILGEPVSTAADVYSLGAVLFELLTGERPHGRARSIADLLAHVERDTVERPSTVVKRLARDDRTLLRRAGRLSGDLDNIVLKALHRDPLRHYRSAAAMADDLRRYLAERPVEARPDSAKYRLGKFVLRNRVAVLAGSALALAVLASLGSNWVQARRAEEQGRRAEAALRFLSGLFDVGSVEGSGVTARDLLDHGAARIDEDFAGAPDLQAEMYIQIGTMYRRMGLFAEASRTLERAVEATRELSPPNPLRTADALCGLADSLLGEHRGHEALPVARQCLDLRRAKLPVADPAITDAERLVARGVEAHR